MLLHSDFTAGYSKMLSVAIAAAALLLDASAAVPSSCFVAPAPASLRNRLHASAAQPLPRSLARSCGHGSGRVCGPLKADAGEDEAHGKIKRIMIRVGAAWWRILSVSAGMLRGAACALSLNLLSVPDAAPRQSDPALCAPSVSCFSHSLGSTVAAVCVCAGLGTRREGAPGGGAQNAAQPWGRIVEEEICCGCAGAECSAIFLQRSAACRESIGWLPLVGFQSFADCRERWLRTDRTGPGNGQQSWIVLPQVTGEQPSLSSVRADGLE